MIASVGSNPPIEQLATSASGPSAPGAPPDGTQGLKAQQQADAAAQQATEQAAKAREAAIAEDAASAGGPSVHPAEVHFIRDPDANMVATQVRDSVTGDEIAQFPSDSMLKTMASIHQAIGLLLDKRS